MIEIVNEIIEDIEWFFTGLFKCCTGECNTSWCNTLVSNTSPSNK